MRITAIVPVKAHSSRLPNKNVLPFAESNLLEHKLKQLSEVPSIDDIVVSSDSQDMLEMARRVGVVAWERPEYLADESHPFSDFVAYVAQKVDTDIIVWACVTSPLMETGAYETAIHTFLEAEQQGYDSLVAVLPFQHFLLDEQGPYNFQRGVAHVNSQDLSKLYLFTNGVIIARRSDMVKWQYHFGPQPYYFEVNQVEALDIDTEWDYLTAKAIWEYLQHHTNS